MALDRWAREEIDEVVGEWTGDRKLFTAFEVSIEAKSRGVNERHRNMKDHVHGAIARIGSSHSYTRTLMDVGAQVQAWVYHHTSDNPYTYRPLDRGNTRQRAAAPATAAPSPNAAPVYQGLRNPVPLTAGAGSPRNNNDGVCGTDSQGRVTITSAMLTRMDIEAGETAIVVCDAANKEIRITRPTIFDDNDPDTNYSVEPDGSIRIAPDALNQAAIGGMQSYKVSGDSDCITIQPS